MGRHLAFLGHIVIHIGLCRDRACPDKALGLATAPHGATGEPLALLTFDRLTGADRADHERVDHMHPSVPYWATGEGGFQRTARPNSQNRLVSCRPGFWCPSASDSMWKGVWALQVGEGRETSKDKHG